MDQNLRMLFDRALADEPEPPSVDLAGHAMAIGGRLRRRREQTVAAGVAAVVTVAAVGVASVARPPDRSAPPPTAVPAAFGMLVNKACAFPARETATDASVFLTMEITDQQRSAVNRALATDPAVGTLVFESRDQALARYRKIFADVPELVAPVRADQLPESFRIKLTGRSQYANLAVRVERMPGVDEMIGIDCPAGTSASAVD
ncbi:permease-like cell division protein FtsX [Micromonospora parathelypteridis]|uniref:FtsX extracellular domain-containing protein n=1 Tax=Micromonospora parathelypteridis TaxID=1839617 RepID=A0A840VWQ9_9ACTN|nr:permease-like cell division protein FtsX [Micromonospora parathelypteridis]MBB5480436.1 hypothetical protein [Micromonospora parathelypteridis]GGO23378.1 hypothetical protein GCM10011576_43720 [Micromonospora parathelypteridis]